MKVNSLGKWKTACQMVGLSALLSFREAHLLLGSRPASARLRPLAEFMLLVVFPLVIRGCRLQPMAESPCVHQQRWMRLMHIANRRASCNQQ